MISMRVALRILLFAYRIGALVKGHKTQESKIQNYVYLINLTTTTRNYETFTFAKNQKNLLNTTNLLLR